MNTKVVLILGLWLGMTSVSFGKEFKIAPQTVIQKNSENSKDLYYQMILYISRKYNVPAGILYGIWRKETSLLEYGWRTAGGDWFLARELPKPTGRCPYELSKSGRRTFAQALKVCINHWQSLKAICAQKRHNNSPVCDSNQVYSSWALAVGPTQHLPAEIIKWERGADGLHNWKWTRDAVDADRDGVVDPLNFVDAMAMTAIQLIRYKAQADAKMGIGNPRGGWRWATNRYCGSQKEAYFDGRWEIRPSGKRRFRYGVRDHWTAWCQYMGCQTNGPTLAFN